MPQSAETLLDATSCRVASSFAMNTSRPGPFASLVVSLSLACTSSAPAPADDVAVLDDAALVDVNDEFPPAPLGTGSDAYGNCTAPARRLVEETCAGSLACLPYFTQGLVTQWCSAPCDPKMRGADCPRAPAGSTATPLCLLTDRYCYLQCRTNEECPRGMVCHNGFVCGWVRGS